IDEALVKLVQVEHKDAVRNIDAILEVEGIDGVVIGPYDLSGSLGLLGQLQHPAVLEQCEKVVASCKAHAVPCGPSIGPANDGIIKFWLDRNVDFIFCGDDMTFVSLGVAATLAKINDMRGA
ncbi:MAG: 4-hydroxy-3-methylbut-2-en-1-yl diphosphate synthase, partial [Planctomycetota bacterium]|nr:4-hydroxy-3-methylbut-2-en-1-yl diphosphate synthase [Planctomycetota bacterium]